MDKYLMIECLNFQSNWHYRTIVTYESLISGSIPMSGWLYCLTQFQN